MAAMRPGRPSPAPISCSCTPRGCRRITPRNGWRARRGPMCRRSRTTATPVSAGTMRSAGSTTHPLPDGSRLGLRIADLTLAFLDVHPHALPLDGRADAEVRTWLGGHVAARNLAAGKLDDPPPYAMPDHVLALGARYSLDEIGDALKVLRHVVCQCQRRARGRAEASRGEEAEGAGGALLAAPFRSGLPGRAAARPHHGDRLLPRRRILRRAVFLHLDVAGAVDPGLPLLPAMAHWHTYKFLAALAPAHKIVAAHDQGAYVRQFLDVSVAAALNALR